MSSTEINSNITSNNLLTVLYGVSRAGVFALENASDKLVQVFYSKNIALTLGQVLASLEDYGSMKHDLAKLVVRVIQEESDTRNGRCIQKHTIQEYMDKGYSLYRGVHNLASYKLDKRIIYQKGTHLFELYLVSSNGTKIVLGYFPHHRDLKRFVSLYYPDNKITRIVKHESLLVDG